ncbi:TPA: branched-chain amino acid transaminase [Morganella morganii subsp. morganii]|uniref:Branched-chain-amino-acid aminotransferase n=1 Tax=Morganella morganii TaxID=582 RepID=A0AAU8ZJ66_MORMO|nr:branched-chain amino acid transaminase [Morganella morganii]HDS6887465.1 branched-chain amino acid transaminase [Morganella morganii subsp. morganii]AVK36186.1 branched-chain amino acid aminotransferase [Morganella morganii]AWC93152.1 branched-chain amino acid transaminase [Morganella morganii]EKW8487232.1 branched-chain amino acid transaminase [Morganella morganii]ELO7538581.1 branched-chain amino acid transaminase [Morganella morganii]
MNEQSRLIWLSGKIVPIEQAMINVLAPTSQFGLNVFEGIRGYWNDNDKQLYLFRLEDHYSRLLKSIKMARFDCNYTVEFLEKSAIDIIKANNYRQDIAIRQTVFIDGSGNWAATGPVDMFIAPIAKPAQQSNEGIHCCISSWDRINDKSLPPKIKMGANYMNSRLGQMEAKRNGYDSTIFLNETGKVSEGPGSCLFIVRDNVLITPSLTSSVLESITRDTILTFARDTLKLKVEEREIDRTELYICDEIFMCGSAVEILPVLSVDKLNVGDGFKGKITKQIESLYFDILRNKSPEYKNWLTGVY